MKDARERRGETKVRANLKSFRPLLPGSHPDLPIFFFFFFSYSPGMFSPGNASRRNAPQYLCIFRSSGT